MSAGGKLAPGRSLKARRPLSTRSWSCGREAARRLAQPPLKELDHALGKGKLALRVERVFRRQIVGDQEQGHVAHDLRRRRHLDDVAEEQVDLAVGVADLMPARRPGPAPWPAGTGSCTGRRAFPGRKGRRPAIAGRTRTARTVPDFFPVAADLDQGLVVNAGVARCEAKRLDDRAQAGLRGQARHRSHGPIGDVQPDFGALEDAADLGSANVVRVEMDRQRLLPDGASRSASGRRTACTARPCP